MQIWVPYSWATQFLVGGPSAFEGAREAAGLDQPLGQQYVTFMTGLLQGDLGTSFGGAPVFDLIREALPVTITVFVAGSVIGWVIGELLGRLGSWNRHGRDRLAHRHGGRRVGHHLPAVPRLRAGALAARADARVCARRSGCRPTAWPCGETR